MLGPFGDYTLLRRIGAGGMAEVFLARRDRGAGRGKIAVLKRVLPHYRDRDELVELFLNEARLAASLVAPNIARVLDAGRVDGRDYLCTELVLGADLARVRSRCTPSPRATLGLGAIARLASDVCAGLHAAHEARDADGQPLEVIHGDVHPRNVLISFDGVAKLIDFGVARATATAADAPPRGTYAYMAPEQLRGEPSDRRADVFAAGVLLWETVAGRSLFTRGANYLTLTAVVEAPAPPLAALHADVGAELDALLAPALAKSPAERYASCAELADALSDLAARLGWDDDAESLAAPMRELFADELARLSEAVAAAGKASVEDWLCALSDEVDVDWLLSG